MFKSQTFRLFLAVWLFLLLSHGPVLASDPTRPPFLDDTQPKVVKHKRRASPPLVLNGILYSTDRQVAIINNKVVSVGEMVSEANIMEISRHYVTVKRRGKKTRLLVKNQPDVKALSKRITDSPGK